MISGVADAGAPKMSAMSKLFPFEPIRRRVLNDKLENPSECPDRDIGALHSAGVIPNVILKLSDRGDQLRDLKWQAIVRQLSYYGSRP